MLLLLMILDLTIVSKSSCAPLHKFESSALSNASLWTSSFWTSNLSGPLLPPSAHSHVGSSKPAVSKHYAVINEEFITLLERRSVAQQPSLFVAGSYYQRPRER
ncbi:hypothetical protein CPB83DRAFT_846719 [Crepidotus variabilis]|uniref:Secreted protein n=1 Tax=Crepidotus variabilis TaxID=179855 RepID=A0A9P6EQ84_9AGAR|nr:hypothetical protein CPB83DRAFT_846719 [Crepidotus variabilis]